MARLAIVGEPYGQWCFSAALPSSSKKTVFPDFYAMTPKKVYECHQRHYVSPLAD